MEREASLYWWGLGLGAMLLNLIMMIRSVIELETKHRTRWDSKVGAIVLGRQLDRRTYGLIAVGTVLVVAVTVLEFHIAYPDALAQ